MSLEDLREGVDRNAIFAHSLLFIAGFSIVFITAGGGALVHHLRVSHAIWGRGGIGYGPGMEDEIDRATDRLREVLAELIVGD